MKKEVGEVPVSSPMGHRGARGRRTGRVRAALALLTVGLCGMFSLPAQASDLAVVFSCPLYDPGPPEAGNNPSSPTNPQANVLEWTAINSVFQCAIQYGNLNPNESLQNVRFELRVPTATWPVADPVVLPDGNAYSAGAQNQPDVFSYSRRLLEYSSIPSGFETGSWNGSTNTYTWNLASIPAATTGELRVGFRGNMVPDGPYAIEVHAFVDNNASGAPQVVLGRYAPESPTALTAEIGHQTTPGEAVLSGQHMMSGLNYDVSPVSQWLPVHGNVTLYAYLPYWDGAAGEFRADGLFNPANANHVTLFDRNALTIQHFWGPTTSPIFTIEPGLLTGPESGYNAGRVVIYDPDTLTIRVEMGSFPGPNANLTSTGAARGITWVAPRTFALSVGQNIPLRTCMESDQTRSGSGPVLVCKNGSLAVVGEVSGPTFAHLYNNGRWESSPLIPREVIHTLSTVTYTNSDMYEEGTIYVQAPGDSEKRADFERANWGTGVSVPHIQLFDLGIWVSTKPSDYGSEADLSARMVPQATEADWVRCDNALGSPGLHCDHQHLAALGIDPRDVHEVRFDLGQPLYPFHYYGYPSPNHTQRRGDVRWRLNASARASIDGSNYNANDMTRSSVGSKATAVFKRGGIMRPLERASTSNAELDRKGVTHTSPWACPINRDVTIDEPVRIGIFGWRSGGVCQDRGFGNMGSLPNVYGPFVVETTMPEGYRFDLADVKVWKKLSPNNISQNYQNPWDENDYQVQYDEVTRQLRINIQVDSPDQVLQGGEDPDLPDGELIGFSVTIDGNVLIGAPREMQTENTTISFFAENSAGDVVAGSVTTNNSRSREVDLFLNNVAPALNLLATADPNQIESGEAFAYTYHLNNIAFGPDGNLLPEGATGSARDTVIFQRVTSPGDYPLVEGTGANARFVEAEPVDAVEIWVSTLETPPLNNATIALDPANGWQLCWVLGDTHDTCDGAALAGLGLAPTAVRWVAFNFDEVRITDAEPRGVAPRDGNTRENNPYQARLHLVDDGTDDGARIRARASVYSRDTATAQTSLEGLDVFVGLICAVPIGEECMVGVGQCEATGITICSDDGESTICEGQPGLPVDERCDELDWSCSGDPYTSIDADGNEYVVYPVGDECVVSYDFVTVVCEIPGIYVCNENGTGVTCEYDEDEYPSSNGKYPDYCDCLRLDGETCTTYLRGCSVELEGTYSCTENGLICDISELDTNGSGYPDVCDCEYASGQDCQVDFDGCLVDGVLACDRERQTYCDISQAPDADGDNVPDSCDCAPNDPAFFTMAPGVSGSCDADDDGYCSAEISGQPNVTFCPDGFDDCDDDNDGINPGASERCDDVDWNCDGDPYDGYDDHGDSCTVGIGQCARTGVYICSADGSGVVCSVEAGEPEAERCDALDWDCDGEPLNGFDGYGDTCSAGVGQCAADGFFVCTADGSGLECDALVGEPEDERCDELDWDCDGESYNGFDEYGETCTVGVGQCARTGVYICGQDGTIECSVEAGEPEAERCDDLDWDCDGEALNGFDDHGESCTEGVGQCAADGVYVCAEDGSGLVCDAVAGEPGAERCDDLDWDCDGDPHNGLDSIGESCTVGIGQCAAEGVYVCGIDGAIECSATAGTPAEERCDDLDWSCDGDPHTGLPVDEACTVSVDENCELEGFYTCDLEGNLVCDTGDAICQPLEEEDPIAFTARGSGLRCATTPGGNSAPGSLFFVALLLGGFALIRRRGASAAALRAMLGLSLGSAAFFTVPVAEANEPDLNGSLPIQQFQPLPGGNTNFISTSSAAVLDHLKFSAGIYLNYAHRPLVLESTRGDEVELIRHHLQGDILGAIGLFDQFELGLAVPMTLYQSAGESNALPTREISPLAFGDIRLYPKWAIHSPTEGAGFALVAVTTLPSGSVENMSGDVTPTFEPRFVVDYRHRDGMRFGANLGYVIRGDQGLVDIDVGNELTYRFAYEHPIQPQRWSAMAEVYGRVALDGDVDITPQNSPAELMLATRYHLLGGHALTGAVGPGLSIGYGAPLWRSYVGYTYTYEAPPEPVFVCDDVDNPSLRVDDEGCPMACPVVENPSTQLDDYGCATACPSVENPGAELDEFGCPISCPVVENPSTRTDEGGCPIACPVVEYSTGEVDEFGCAVACPEVDVYSGFFDELGCPVGSSGRAYVTQERIIITEKIFFEYDKDIIKEESYDILEKVAEILRDNPQLESVEVQGHTDSQGGHDYNIDLSQRRSESVRRFLMGLGIAESRLTAKGYGLTQPIDTNETEEGRANNRRVEFVIRHRGTPLEGFED